MRLRTAVLTGIVCLTLVLAHAQSDAGQGSPPRVSSDRAEQHLVNRIQPQYPALAKAAGIQGIVRLSIVIDEQGNVKDLKLVSGHPMLAPAVIETVRKWKYRPFEVHGKSSAVLTEVQVSLPEYITQADIDKARRFQEAYAENYNEGQVDLKKGDLTTAEAKLSLARKAAEEVGDERWRELAGVLYLLGTLKKDQNDFSAAEQAYKEALDVLLKHQSPDDLDVAGAQEDLATLYYSNSQFEKAEPFIRQSIRAYEVQMRDTTSPKDHAGIGRNLAIEYAALSQIDLAKGSQRESQDDCRQAVDYAEKWSKPADKETIVSRCAGASTSK